MPEKRDKQFWIDRVKSSSGTSIFLPENFVKDAEEIKKTVESYNEEINKLNEKEIHMTVATQNFWLALREFLAKNGQKDIWIKEIGWEAEAMKEGIFIVNIRDRN